eukprot:SAG22_NODE_4093_length_1388_cov_1.918542_1_plen_294_part_00
MLRESVRGNTEFNELELRAAEVRFGGLLCADFAADICYHDVRGRHAGALPRGRGRPVNRIPGLEVLRAEPLQAAGVAPDLIVSVAARHSLQLHPGTRRDWCVPARHRRKFGNEQPSFISPGFSCTPRVSHIGILVAFQGGDEPEEHLFAKVDDTQFLPAQFLFAPHVWPMLLALFVAVVSTARHICVARANHSERVAPHELAAEQSLSAISFSKVYHRGGLNNERLNYEMNILEEREELVAAFKAAARETLGSDAKNGDSSRTHPKMTGVLQRVLKLAESGSDDCQSLAPARP